jgi:hypothetical protein
VKKLTLTIFRKYFDEIAIGKKKEEYREIKPYWEVRLSKNYDVVEFRNGYRLDPPILIVEYKGYKLKRIRHPTTKVKRMVYVILLGRILEIKNYGNHGKIQQGKG